MCRATSPEQIISQTLTDMGIDHIQQHTFEQCKSPLTYRPLRYDFFIPKLNMLIEYDGIYHYEAVSHGEDSGELRLQRQQWYDSIKTEFAYKNGMRLVRIPFFSDNNLSQQIRDVVNQHLQPDQAAWTSGE